MIYLLDVSVLIALGDFEHVFHARVMAWLQTVQPTLMLTCSITELGFVRVLSNLRSGLTIPEAQRLLFEMKRSGYPPLRFVSDNLDASYLPSWVGSSKQTTDGHLVELARANNALLATLDEGIPGSHLIPHIQ